jgi:hypothetical protein
LACIRHLASHIEQGFSPGFWNSSWFTDGKKFIDKNGLVQKKSGPHQRKKSRYGSRMKVRIRRGTFSTAIKYQHDILKMKEKNSAIGIIVGQNRLEQTRRS